MTGARRFAAALGLLLLAGCADEAEEIAEGLIAAPPPPGQREALAAAGPAPRRPMSPIERERARHFAEGYAAYQGGDYGRALAIWRELADKGDLAAMRNVGQLYRLGQGVERDAGQAARWFERAADLGLANAQANLGALYLAGDGVEQDPKQAARWFARAAHQGHVVSQYELALLFEEGKGVERNPRIAQALLKAAADAGYGPARTRLGLDPAAVPTGREPSMEMPPQP